ncbi:S1 family peptidase [Dactylosporangium sp. CA-139066]|uniref:S1 family peptidase n=1 Tax=Dactylosporangium sp. CA-139066 TaxID=3239930 RepID=UPI003D8EBD82
MLTLVVLAAIAGPAEPAWAIAHGEDAPAGDYPFSVRLTMTGIPTADSGARDSWCSGALVAPRWVITAGHCFRDAGDQRVSRPVARRTTATIGRGDLSRPGGHEVEVVAVRQAETADVALAELATPVTDVTPLLVGDAPPAAGETVRLTGFGQTDADSGAPARLQTGEFVIGRIGDSDLEVSGRSPRPDTSACPHDSGGPYFREAPGAAPVLVGVVSNGPTCPHKGADVSARTDNLAGWIAGVTGARPNPLLDPSLWLRLGGGALALLLVVLAIRAGRQRTTGAAVRRA